MPTAQGEAQGEGAAGEVGGGAAQGGGELGGEDGGGGLHFLGGLEGGGRGEGDFAEGHVMADDGDALGGQYAGQAQVGGGAYFKAGDVAEHSSWVESGEFF